MLPGKMVHSPGHVYHVLLPWHYVESSHFQIIYTAEKNNQKADILSRREQDLETQESAKKDSRLRVLLGLDRLDPRINAELAEVFVEKTIQCILAPILASLSLVEDTESDLIRDLQIDNQKSF